MLIKNRSSTKDERFFSYQRVSVGAENVEQFVARCDRLVGDYAAERHMFGIVEVGAGYAVQTVRFCPHRGDIVVRFVPRRAVRDLYPVEYARVGNCHSGTERMRLIYHHSVLADELCERVDAVYIARVAELV